MSTQTPTRPTLKHALTATAVGLVTIRNAWRAYMRGLSQQRRENVEKQRRGWGA